MWKSGNREETIPDFPVFHINIPARFSAVRILIQRFNHELHGFDPDKTDD